MTMETEQQTFSDKRFVDTSSPPATAYRTTSAFGLEDGLPKIGEILGDCTLEQIVHVGNMVVVYRGISAFSGADFAIKICRLSSSKAYRRAFVLKRNLHAKLNSPEMASFNTGGIWNGELPYSIISYYEGRTLQNILENVTCIPSLIVLAIGKMVLEALKNSCEKIESTGWAGYLYRCIWSISPDNIMITKVGDLKILDIGLEQFFDDRLALDMKWQELPPPQYSTTMDLSTAIYSVGTFFLSMLYGWSESIEMLSDPALLSKKQKHSEILQIIRKCMTGKLGTGYTGFDEIVEDTEAGLRLLSTASAQEIIKAWFLEGKTMRKKPKLKPPF